MDSVAGIFWVSSLSRGPLVTSGGSIVRIQVVERLAIRRDNLDIDDDEEVRLRMLWHLGYESDHLASTQVVGRLSGRV